MCSFAQTDNTDFVFKNLLNGNVFVCTNTVGNTLLSFAQTVKQRCFRLHKLCPAIVFSLQKQVGNGVFVCTNTGSKVYVCTNSQQCFRLHSPLEH